MNLGSSTPADQPARLSSVWLQGRRGQSCDQQISVLPTLAQSMPITDMRTTCTNMCLCVMTAVIHPLLWLAGFDRSVHRTNCTTAAYHTYLLQHTQECSCARKPIVACKVNFPRDDICAHHMAFGTAGPAALGTLAGPLQGDASSGNECHTPLLVQKSPKMPSLNLVGESLTCNGFSTALAQRSRMLHDGSNRCTGTGTSSQCLCVERLRL